MHLVQHGCQADFLQHIQVVVAGSTIRAKSHMHPCCQKLRHRSHAAGKLHVAARIVDRSNRLFLHHGNISIIQPYAVGGNGRTVKEPCFGNILERALAVLFLNLPDFILCFGHVDMHIDAVLCRNLRCRLAKIRRTGIWCMDTQQNADQAITGTMIVLVQIHVFCQAFHSCRRKANQAAAENPPDTCTDSFLCHRLHAWAVHISIGSSAALDHLHQCQLCPHADVILHHLCLHRPNPVVQPVHQLHIVSIAAEQCHGGMGVGIYQPRHRKAVLAFNNIISSKILRNLPYGTNHIIRNGNICHACGIIRLQHIGALNQYLHL